MPRINFTASWPQIKKFFLAEMKIIVPELLKLN